MISPLQIEFRNTQPIETVEFRIKRELAEFEKFYNRLVSCRVEVETPKHERRGSVSTVRIDLGVPSEDAAAAELRAKKGTEHLEVKAQRKDASMAVHAAFNIARRRLNDFTSAPYKGF
jgi:ribosome-associated translation inhibitor RaiA